jgi:hypothetical protein
MKISHVARRALRCLRRAVVTVRQTATSAVKRVLSPAVNVCVVR